MDKSGNYDRRSSYSAFPPSGQDHQTTIYSEGSSSSLHDTSSLIDTIFKNRNNHRLTKQLLKTVKEQMVKTDKWSPISFNGSTMSDSGRSSVTSFSSEPFNLADYPHTQPIKQTVHSPKIDANSKVCESHINETGSVKKKRSQRSSPADSVISSDSGFTLKNYANFGETSSVNTSPSHIVTDFNFWDNNLEDNQFTPIQSKACIPAGSSTFITSPESNWLSRSFSSLNNNTASLSIIEPNCNNRHQPHNSFSYNVLETPTVGTSNQAPGLLANHSPSPTISGIPKCSPNNLATDSKAPSTCNKTLILSHVKPIKSGMDGNVQNKNLRSQSNRYVSLISLILVS